MVQSSRVSKEVPSLEAIELAQRLHQQPQLQARVEELLAVVENVQGDLGSANAAEQRVVEQIKKLGQAALQGWAERQNQHQTRQFIDNNPGVHRSRQKNSIGTPDSAPSQSSSRP